MQRIKKISIVTGLLIGSFALSVLAEDMDIVSSGWKPAPCTPDQCNTASPLNVSKTVQNKDGGLSLGGLSLINGYALEVNGLGYFTGLKVAGTVSTKGLIVEDGDQTKGGVLTNDGTGKAEWKPINQLNGNGSTGSSLNSSYCYASKASGSYPVGAFDGYYLKGLIKSTGDVQVDGGRSSVGGVYCLASGSSDPRMTNAVKNSISSNAIYGPVVYRSIGLSYKDLVSDCNTNRSSYGISKALGIPQDQSSLTICPAMDPF